MVQTHKIEATFLTGIKLCICSPKFTDFSHSSLVFLVSEHMENENIFQDTRVRLGKLCHEGNAGAREVVSSEGADESVLEIYLYKLIYCLPKDSKRGIDGCKKGDCSFLEYSYARPNDANSFCPILEGSLARCRAAVSSIQLRDSGSIPVIDLQKRQFYEMMQHWFLLRIVTPVVSKDLPSRKEGKKKRKTNP